MLVDDELILKVENLSKVYSFSKNGYSKSIKEFFDASKHGTLEYHQLEALNNVSFQLNKGESLGVIGDNGAGKSTLLKILGGITKPSSGKVILRGRVRSVLDIGTGFHPDLTGRENIYLSGEILGLSRNEVSNKYQQIVDFSGIAQFINKPVKYYSSGMYLRLAFSTITFLSGDILLFDEAISAGDAGFKRKLIRRMQHLRQSGTTMIIVSHNFSEIFNLCDKVLLLENGNMKAFGTTHEVTDKYLEQSIINEQQTEEKNGNNSVASSPEIEKIVNERKDFNYPEIQWEEKDAPGNQHLKILRATLYGKGQKLGQDIYLNKPIVLNITIIKLSDEDCDLGLSITDNRYNLLFAFTTAIHHDSKSFKKPGKYTLAYEIPANIFNKGIFMLEIVVFANKQKHDLFRKEVLTFKINYPDKLPDKKVIEQFPGPLRFDIPCRVSKA